VDKLSGHVIVCGLSNLGFRLVEQLHAAAVTAVVVDEHVPPSLGRRVERWGVRVLPEAPHTAEALADAGIDRAAALVACHDVDLVNLETALLVAEIAPYLRLIVRSANPKLADQLAAALPAARVLSLAGKAGPAFVEACLRSDVLHAFRMNGEIFEVVDARVRAPGTFRHLFGSLTPVALRRPGERLAEVCPGRDTPVAPGDQVALLGRPSDFADNGVVVVGEQNTATLADLNSAESGSGPARGRHRGPRAWLRDLVGSIGDELDRPFRLALLAVVVIVLVSTAVLSATYRANNPAAPTNFDALDALYLTVETMVTVGYGDYNFGAADHWLQVFGIGLMLCGALSIAVVYAFITNVIISRRLERALGRGRTAAVHDHVIVCGLGSVGLATVDGLLAAGREVVVIERDENNRFLSAARERGVPVILGDATVPSTLLEAGLARSATLAALTSDDVANLETVLSAREAFADAALTALARSGAGGRSYPRSRDQKPRDLRVVLRVFDTHLAAEVERRFAIHTARSDAALATPWFLGAALDYEVVSTFYVDNTPFVVARMHVAAGGGLDGPTLVELSTGTRVLAIGENYRPTRHTRLRPGDEVLIVGPYAQIIDTVRRNRQVGADLRSDH
jgi:Trk K+ transport system NAD-binding subunit